MSHPSGVQPPTRRRRRPAGPVRVGAADLRHRLVVEATRPSAVGPATWSAIAGPWEIDYSYASMRAVELHPFNDSTHGRSFWWLIRRDGRPVGMYAGYVTETYSFGPLFMVGPLRVMWSVTEVGYRWLNRHGLYRYLDRVGLARFLRIASARTRVMLLGASTADVGGHVIGEALRDQPPATYLPALIEMIEMQARALGVEQVTFREAAEAGAGPFRFPNLWTTRGPSGRRLLAAAGYRRNAGFPPGYVDLRDVQAWYANNGDGVYAWYRHPTRDAFITYETERRAWLESVASLRQAEGRPALPMELAFRHPRLTTRAADTRLHRFRGHLFRGGLLPDALVRLAQLDRAEAALKNAPQTLRRLERLRSVEAELRRRVASAQVDLPGDAEPAVYLRAREILTSERVPDRAAVGELAAAHAQERMLAATLDPRFAGLPSGVRSTYTQLAAGRIRQADRERRRLLAALGWSLDAPEAERARIEAIHDERLALAAVEGARDRELRRARTEVASLSRTAGVRAEDAQCWVQAFDLLDRHGGRLPDAAAAVAERLATLGVRLAAMAQAIDAADGDLRKEALDVERLLLGQAAAAVRDDLERAMRAGFRREQDRLAAERGGGRAPGSSAERREWLTAALRYRPLDYGRLLRDNENLRDTDRDRLVREYREHQAAVRRGTPAQPGPEMPEFDAEGYLARGLLFSGRDDRVWTNLADQDQITRLYHRTMAASQIRHDVEDWPYRAAYRAAGRETGDQIHIATLRAGGPSGPIVAAVTVKRSRAGHFRPERIAKPGHDFGAYYSLVLLVMAYEVERGGTWCSLGQTSQGTKMREFGAAFIDVHEYTRFRGLVPRLLGFDLFRRRAYREIHVDQILQLAAMRPEARAEEARRHGIRWHI